MNKTLRNYLVAPIVIFIRFPVIATLIAIVVIGKLADKACDKVCRIIPGFRR